MNPRMQLIFFIALGAAHLSAVLGSDAIKKCYLTSYVAGTKCPDYSARIDCLEEIDPDNDMEENMLVDALTTTKYYRDTCRDWKVGCLNDLRNECMEEFRDKKYLDTGVCEEISAARDCLRIINNTCDGKYLADDLGDLKFHSSLCADGHFSDGPCSIRAVKNCTAKVIIDRGVEFELGYNCQSGLVKDAKMCLADMKTSCLTKAMRVEMRFRLHMINRECTVD